MVHRPKRILPRPDLVRCIDGSFGWIDHRLLRDGHLGRLTLEDLGVYVFLVLAADREGLSYYRVAKIADALALRPDQIVTARERLVERGLIAFEPFRAGDVEGYYQVLPLGTRGAP